MTALDARLDALARGIDPERWAALSRDLPGDGAASLARLLGVVYPPLLPAAEWQRAACDRLWHEGWRVERRRVPLLERFSLASGDLSDSDQALPRFRREVWAEKARIAVRELLPVSLGGVGVDVTAREISILAEVAWEIALGEASSHVERRFGPPLRSDGRRSALVVIGLGKLGGEELNAGSDVDVQFVYDTDDGGSGTSLHDHWTRVARRAVATLETPTPEGLVWRVDLRLRPEGSQGPIVNSVAAMERYYETWGRTWERAALLRARAVAGSIELGEILEREVFTPFVYRREVDPRIATAMAEMVLRSREELSPTPDRDLKLGPGGIRETEFFVQSLQLVWGGRESSLRVPGTLPALERLRARGLVSHREVQGVTHAYHLLRRLEHRVQWMTGVQTHLLPDRGPERERLAKSMGFTSAEGLDAELARVRGAVERRFASLSPSAPRPPARHQALFILLERRDPELPDAVAAALGSSDVAEHLVALARRPDGLFGSSTRERLPELADEAIEAIAESPDPEQAARYLRSLLGRFNSPWAYVSALAEDPRALRRLAYVLGASAFVGDAVVQNPEIADELGFGRDHAIDPARVLDSELRESWKSLARDLDGDDARQAFVDALRRAKRRVMVEVAVADLAGSLHTRDTTRELSNLADEIVERAVRFELGGDVKGLAVIAMGKLGGRDIGYGSDLDVIFVYDADGSLDPSDADHRFVRAAQRIVRLISSPSPAGPGYELDTRLRPSGSQGLLVTSLRSFARYHGVATADDEVGSPSVRATGAAWERQALLRARGCAGDRDLCRRVMAIAAEAAYERGAPPAEEIARLRARMEAELAREKPGRWDLKLGHGGLADVEFSVQWLQMRHGRDRRVRTGDTQRALDVLAALGYLPRPEYETLREGYAFLRRLEQRIHVHGGHGTTAIDASSPGLTHLARRMGLADAPGTTAKEALIERYLAVTRAVRRAYLGLLGLPEPGAAALSAP